MAHDRKGVVLFISICTEMSQLNSACYFGTTSHDEIFICNKWCGPKKASKVFSTKSADKMLVKLTPGFQLLVFVSLCVCVLERESNIASRLSVLAFCEQACSNAVSAAAF